MDVTVTSASRTAVHAVLHAIVGGALGFVVTVVVGYVTRDPFEFYARGLVTASVLGASVGWLVGAAVGLRRTRAAPPGSAAEAWAIRALGALVVVVAATTAWWTQALPRTLGLGYHVTAREPLESSIWLAAAIAAVSCVAFAQTRGRRAAIVIGAIVAVGLVVVAMVLVATGPCPLSHCDEVLAAGG
jgi:hypothetical protein